MNLSAIYTFYLLKMSFDSKILISNLKIINSNTKFVCRILSHVTSFRKILVFGNKFTINFQGIEKMHNNHGLR